MDATVLAPSGAATAAWGVRAPVAGFREILRLPKGKAGDANASLQVLYSDGAATISVEVQASPPAQLVAPVESGSRLNALSLQRDGVWLTLRGDVPPATLSQFAAALQVGP